MITGESRPVAKAPGRPGDRRHDQRRRQPARARHRHRRADRPGRHHAPGGAGAAEQVAHPGAGRPGRRLAVLRRPGRRRRHRRRLDARHRLRTWRWSSGWRPCWSSPARTPWGWPSRWWSPSPPRSARGTASWCATGWRWRRRAQIDTVIFDKTGTLTEGEFGVVGMATAEGWDEDEALALAAAVEGDSEHTIARGIRRSGRGARAGAAGGRPASRRSRGAACAAGSDGHDGLRGRPAPAGDARRWQPPERLRRFAEAAGATGPDRRLPGARTGRWWPAFALADVIRPESRAGGRAAARRWASQVAMLTGDSEAVARAVAAELGIDQLLRRGAARAQGPEGGRAAAPGQAGGHGRRRRQRRAGADPRRRGHRHRQRHRRGRRVGGHHPGAEQPAGRGQDHRAEPGQLPQDGPEPGVGHRLQRGRPAAGGRRPGARRASCSRRPWARCSCRSARSSWPSTPSCCAGCAWPRDEAGGPGRP